MSCIGSSSSIISHCFPRSSTARLLGMWVVVVAVGSASETKGLLGLCMGSFDNRTLHFDQSGFCAKTAKYAGSWPAHDVVAIGSLSCR
ncbi:hypothetical protein DPMN_020739 [Dreissena polymorpha]|uniref:Uncharacterized protein n=1 Tax=Dreissena polymorpha TaxID=45954 RepID=A0A9D4NN25_DREPO|nr:hypothetical protein DPMN_020739 [Dreissena polymorpha]